MDFLHSVYSSFIAAEYVGQRVRNGCRGRIADMTVPEALRVDTDGGIKPDMAFLALLAVCWHNAYISVLFRCRSSFFVARIFLSAFMRSCFFKKLFSIIIL